MAYFDSRDSFLQHGLTPLSVRCLNDDECWICFQPYYFDGARPAEKPTQLPCGHIYGKQCILRWTQESNTCPMCRKSLFHNVPWRSSNDNPEVHIVEIEPLEDWETMLYEQSVAEMISPLDTSEDALDSTNSPPSTEQLTDDFSLEEISPLANLQPCGVCHPFCEMQCGLLLSARETERMSVRLQDMLDRRREGPSGTMPHLIGVPDIHADVFMPDEPTSASSLMNLYFEQELKAAEIGMHDLTKTHEQWMDEYVNDTEFEKDEIISYF